MSHIAAPVGVLDSWPYRYEISVNTNTTEYNIRSAVEAAGWDGQSRLIVILTVNADVYSRNDGHWAMRTGNFQGWLHEPIRIVVNEKIIGGGGFGGSASGEDGNPGHNGGYGFVMDGNDEVNFEGNGTISGGGGGGGAGGGVVYYERSGGKDNECLTGDVASIHSGAGGGGGAAFGKGGNSSDCNDGQNAGLTAGGDRGESCNPDGNVRGRGGDGGNWGNNGNSGANADVQTLDFCGRPGDGAGGGTRGYYINTTANTDFSAFSGSTRGRAP